MEKAPDGARHSQLCMKIHYWIMHKGFVALCITRPSFSGKITPGLAGLALIRHFPVHVRADYGIKYLHTCIYMVS